MTSPHSSDPDAAASAKRAVEPTQFELIADAVPALIASFSKDGDYLFVNKAMRQYTGVSLPMRHGSKLRSVVHQGDLARLDPAWRSAFARGETFRVDVRLRGLDGRYRWFDMTATPVLDRAGAIESWCSLSTDVDDRRRLNDDLRQVIDAFPGMIALWDGAQRNRYANSAHEAMFGVGPEALEGGSIASLLGESRYHALRGSVDQALRGVPQFLARDLTTTAGELRHVQTSLIPVIRDDEVQGMLMIDQDVTDAARAAAKLSEAEERFELAFEQSPVGIALLSLDGRFLRVNHALGRIFQCSIVELGDRSLSDLLHLDEVDDSEAMRARLLRGEVTHVEHERLCRRFDGQLIETRIFKSLVRARDGAPLYFVVQLEDISERKHAAVALERANAELRRSNDDLERFAYVASHDLQEPLRTVASYTRLLSDRYGDKLDDSAHRYIDYAVDAAKRMQQLISGLLEMSRLGRVTGPPTPVDLNALVDAVRGLLGEAILTRSAEIEVEPLPVIPGHQEHLLRAFQNLLGNAIKFTVKDRRPKVRVSAARDGAGWRISIRDNGIGIEPEYRERVFGMFQRLHTRDQYPGSGIGLPVVRRILELHYGRVWIGDGEGGEGGGSEGGEGGEGGGTEFCLWLPE